MSKVKFLNLMIPFWQHIPSPTVQITKYVLPFRVLIDWTSKKGCTVLRPSLPAPMNTPSCSVTSWTSCINTTTVKRDLPLLEPYLGSDGSVAAAKSFSIDKEIHPYSVKLLYAHDVIVTPGVEATHRHQIDRLSRHSSGS